MSDKNRSKTDTSAREFVITRLIKAPREVVFEAWTEPEQLAQWWGPHGFTTPVCEVDVRPGGKYRIVMKGPEGVEYPLKGVYREVVEPSKLVFTDDWEDHPAEWTEALMANLPPGEPVPATEALNTVTFESRGGKTLLTIRTLFETPVVRDAMVKMGMNDGWGQFLERLEALVEAKEQYA
jgi:uncharacterized protein YndB with AHSA1/START domain